MRKRPTEAERQAAREFLEHDYARRHLTGEPARAAHHNAEETLREHPRAHLIALAGGPTDLGRLPRRLRAHQLRERGAHGITRERAAGIRRSGYEEPVELRRRTPRERAEDTYDTARRNAGEIVSLGASSAIDSSWGSLIGEIVLWGIGLSLAYLALTRAQAISKLVEGATNVTRAVVSPVVDPLNPKGALA